MVARFALRIARASSAALLFGGCDGERTTARPAASRSAAPSPTAPSASAGDAQVDEQALSASKLRQRTVRQTAIVWSSVHPKDGCPDIKKLVELGKIASLADATDAWGTLFAVKCKNDDVAIVSAGPDRAFGTADDISIP